MESRFTTAEVILGSMVTLLIDATAAIFDLLAPFTAGITAALGLGLQSVMSLGTSWWLMSKGGKRAWRLERQLMKQVSNFAPIIPTAFAAFIIEVVVHNRKIKKAEND